MFPLKLSEKLWFSEYFRGEKKLTNLFKFAEY